MSLSMEASSPGSQNILADSGWNKQEQTCLERVSLVWCYGSSWDFSNQKFWKQMCSMVSHFWEAVIYSFPYRCFYSHKNWDLFLNQQLDWLPLYQNYSKEPTHMGQSGHYLKVYKTSSWLSGGKGRGRMNREIERDINSVLYIKQITDKNLLYWTQLNIL